jgi:hypothetical protein
MAEGSFGQAHERQDHRIELKPSLTDFSSEEITRLILEAAGQQA